MTDSVRRYCNDGDLLPDGREYVLASDYDQLSTRLAASEAEVERLNAAWQCSHNQAMDNGGAAQRAEAERDSLRAKLAEAREIVTNFVGIAKDNGINQMKYDSFGVRVNKFLAAVQSSEKGL